MSVPFTFQLPGICRTTYLIAGLLLWGSSVCLLSAADETTTKEKTGKQVYDALCVKCHGEKGVGTNEYMEPLIGDKSIGELTRLIEKTMPDGKAELCTGEEARLVAEYIHEDFYSPTAQFRNQPPRLDLLRLTVRQHQQIASDLIGSFRPPFEFKEDRGLKGVYYKNRRFGEVAFDRIDNTVDWDFGKDSPAPGKIDKQEYSVRWEGSVIAPETADYEFIVRSGHATRFWVNDLEMPLIDAYVQSGSDEEYSEVIHLTGGRAYPIRLEFSKSNQGVKDDKHQKPEKPAYVSLEWKLPQRVAQIIPRRFLIPRKAPESFILTTKFPPDDRTLGYERGAAVSSEWEQAATEAALEITEYIAGHTRDFTGLPADSPELRERLRKFCQQFAERAFRHSLSDEQRTLYVDRHFADSVSVDQSLKRSLLLILQSPRFLYVDIQGLSRDPQDVAARMALTLWDSIPDEPLRNAALEGKLSDAQQVADQAERMLANERTRFKVHGFFLQWLKMEHVADLAKNEQVFNGFTPEIINDLRSSLELFVDQVAWGESSDFRNLLLQQSIPLNSRLVEFYGVDAQMETEAEFQNVQLKEGPYAGVLTHPYLMASFAYTDSSSPIHRGVFISRALLGRALKTPPIAVAPTPPSLKPDLTTRERVAEQTKAEACIACHAMINPLGFSLESFDAVGRFRKEEQGRPIDDSGTYITREGKQVQFDGSLELAKFLANNPETHDAFLDQLFHYLVKQPIRAYDGNQVTSLRQHFASSNFHIRKLLTQIVVTSSLPPAQVASNTPSTSK